MHQRPTATDVGHGFPSTIWSRILPGEASGERTAAALESLARRYWRPIHHYLRRAMARDDDEALELTQSFFVWIIDTDFLHKADPSRGRFRGFVKAALRNYVADRDREHRTHKRGGDRRFVPLAGGGTDSGAWQLPADEQTPDKILDAAWRTEAIGLAASRLEALLERSGRAVVFAVFRDYFLDPADGVDYRQLAERHGITTVDVSNYLQRAKLLYREQLRAVVADTVDNRVDLDDELAWLLADAE
ncbi:MAG: sigma-70 family RNA polymerase sigma factor [Planctomycetota bacterium]